MSDNKRKTWYKRKGDQLLMVVETPDGFEETEVDEDLDLKYKESHPSIFVYSSDYKKFVSHRDALYLNARAYNARAKTWRVPVRNSLEWSYEARYQSIPGAPACIVKPRFIEFWTFEPWRFYPVPLGEWEGMGLPASLWHADPRACEARER